MVTIANYLNEYLESDSTIRATLRVCVADCELKPELYCQSAQAYRRACYSMGEPLHDAQPDEIDAGADEKDHADHGCDCRRSEYARHNNYAEPTALGSRIHKGGNQNLTRPKNKNNKQRPRRNTYFASFIVDVSVLVVMAVLVRVA